MAATEVQIARSIAAGRMLYGAACLVAPTKAVGPAGARAEGQMRWMIRAFGVRDLVLGTGTLLSLRDQDGGVDRDGAARWVEVSAAADALDLANAAVFHGELDAAGVAGVVALAVPATLGGVWSARRLRSGA
jgi:hypothetical protein